MRAGCRSRRICSRQARTALMVAGCGCRPASRCSLRVSSASTYQRRSSLNLYRRVRSRARSRPIRSGVRSWSSMRCAAGFIAASLAAAGAWRSPAVVSAWSPVWCASGQRRERVERAEVPDQFVFGVGEAAPVSVEERVLQVWAGWPDAEPQAHEVAGGQVGARVLEVDERDIPRLARPASCAAGSRGGMGPRAGRRSSASAAEVAGDDLRSSARTAASWPGWSSGGRGRRSQPGNQGSSTAGSASWKRRSSAPAWRYMAAVRSPGPGSPGSAVVMMIIAGRAIGDEFAVRRGRGRGPVAIGVDLSVMLCAVAVLLDDELGADGGGHPSDRSSHGGGYGSQAPSSRIAASWSAGGMVMARWPGAGCRCGRRVSIVPGRAGCAACASG